MKLKSILYILLGVIIFVLLNIIGMLYFGDEPCQDVDGLWSGYSEEELMGDLVPDIDSTYDLGRPPEYLMREKLEKLIELEKELEELKKGRKK